MKLLIEYYNYVDIFNKIRVNKLLLYRFYNYNVEFVEGVNKNILLKSRKYILY